MNTLKLSAIAVISIYIISSCNPADRNRKIGGSTDTSNVNRGGGPPISDTSTINQVRKQQRQDTIKGDTNYKGNVNPSGHTSQK